MGGVKGEYFCMLYEARRHMPSEPGCLLSQGSWADRLGLAPSSPQKHPLSPPNQHLSNGLGNCFGCAWTALCVRVCWRRVCMAAAVGVVTQ